jgi:hypothetical protein
VRFMHIEMVDATASMRRKPPLFENQIGEYHG